ncbi:MAG: hypothetical protein M3179_07580, partial [Actinomycetota bacterium]|nr:hypothetical protein [Actinomycetota bacterium]
RGAPTAAAPTTSLVPAEPFPAGTAPVPAGTYVASRFAPPFGFTLPEGWRSVNGEGLNYLDLAHVDGDPDSLVTFLRVRQAVDPSTAPATPEEARAAMRPAPEDLVEWLRGHPRLATSEPSPVTKGDLTGTALEATPADVYSYPSCGGGAPARRCVPLFESDDDSYFLPEGSRARFHVLSVGDDVLLAVVEAPADRFDAFAPEAERVLSTLVPR